MMFLLFLIPFSVFSQQEPLQALYSINSTSFNPANAAITNYQVIHTSYRHQWVGIQGAPTTFNASVESRLFNKHSIGLNYMNNRIGSISENRGDFNYNYKINFKGRKRRSLILGGALRFKHIRQEFNDSDIEELSGYDSNLDGNLGVIYQQGYLTKIGLSVTNILENTFNEITYQPERHYYLFGQFGMRVTRKSSLLLRPLIKFTSNLIQGELNITYSIENKLNLGLTYRTTSWIVGLIDYSFKIKNKYFKIGYAFDFDSKKYNNSFRVSHEASLSFLFGNAN